MGVEDKEYPVKVTDDMINKYEDMVHKVYIKFFSKYPYLKDDLLQCGRWGVFLAYQRYETRAKGKCSVTLYTWLSIKTKMTHYIKHERNHILYDTDNSYDFSKVTHNTPTSQDTILDINNALDTLPDRRKTLIIKWANNVPFKDMNWGIKQNAQKQFAKTLKLLKKRLRGYEL